MSDQVTNEGKQRMDQAIDVVRRELAGVRTGRASLSLLDGVKVAAYGSEMPLNQVATLGMPEPSMLTVKPFDGSLISAIEKAILKADVGINPVNDGHLIRLPVPPLNEDRRKQLSKKVHEFAEHGRTALRNVRRDLNDRVKKLEKDGDLAQDDARRLLDEVQKLTDDHVKVIDKMTEAKTKEIMTV